MKRKMLGNLGAGPIFLILLAGSISCVLLSTGSQAADPLSGSSLYADVVKYASFDGHQTATKGDIETSKWIAESLQKAGFKTDVKPWKVSQFFLASCDLKIDGQRIDSFPAWYPQATSVSGKLTLYSEKDTGNLKGNIAFAGAQYGDTANKGVAQLVENAKSAGAIGLIAVCRNMGDSGLLAASNARPKGKEGTEYYHVPLPILTVLVSANDDRKLTDAARAGLTASITIQGEKKANAIARNVMGTLKKGDKWVIITTPYSGWFKCGGERGPGMALFLGLARWTAQQNPRYSYIFVANSGHELNDMGAHLTIDKFFPEYGLTRDNVACWIHLGASIACRSWRKVGHDFEPLNQPNEISYLVATKDLYPLIQMNFKDVKGLKTGTGTYLGELAVIVDKGYNAAGFFGSNYFFHTKMDSERETGPEFLEPVAVSLKKVLQDVNAK